MTDGYHYAVFRELTHKFKQQQKKVGTPNFPLFHPIFMTAIGKEVKQSILLQFCWLLS